MPHTLTQRGLTLIELLVTLAIAAIVMGLAVPGFQAYFRSSTMANVSNEIRGSLILAREEAIRRGQQVVVCNSTNGTACTANGTDWSGGWIVFVNLDADDPPSVDDGEPIVRVSRAVPANTTLRATFSDFVRYSANGQTDGEGRFVACHGNRLAGARVVLVTRSSSPRMGGDANNNNIPEDAAGADITTCAP